MTLWDFAVRAYAAPGVEAACLSLQDDHGQSVPLLLWAAWAGPQDDMILAQAVAITQAWTGAAIEPLRHARRALKLSLPGAAEPRLALRTRIKAAEIEAERLLLEALEALGPPRSKGTANALAAVATAWGDPPPPDAVSRLAEALRAATAL